MKPNEQRFTEAVSRGTVFTVNFLIRWVWLALVGACAGFSSCMHAAAQQSHGMAFCDGPSPTSMQSNGTTPQSSAVISYNAKFTKNLKGKTNAQRVCSRRQMPAQAGVKFRDFMYNALPANTTQASQGVIGTGISVSTLYIDYTLGQWGDFINFSQFLLLTTIDPMVENVEKELAYRCGRSVQKLTLAQADFARTIDASVGALDATTGTQLMTRNTGTQAAGSMAGRDVNPLDDGRFGCLIHPWLITDMMVDNTNNSYVDIMKHTPEGQMALRELPSGTGDEASKVLQLGGITYLPTTQLTTTPNFLATGKTAIRTYMVGEDGLIAVRITNPDRTDIGDGDYRNLSLWRGRYPMGTAFDPTGQIGGGTSYLVTGTWGLPPDPTQRIRAYDFVPQNT